MDQAVVERLRDSKDEGSAALAGRGRHDGRGWAERFAAADDLEVLAEMGALDLGEALAADASSAHSPGKRFVSIIRLGAPDRQEASDFWLEVLDRDECKALPLRSGYVRAFAEGAIEVWNEVKDEL